MRLKRCSGKVAPTTAGPDAVHAQLIGIQYLRAIAALMVALFHAQTQVPVFQPFFDAHLIGRLNLAAGVDIFFVISGFIMMVSHKDSTPLQFVVRRIIRIAPLYWVLTTVLVIATWILPGMFRTTVVTFAGFWKSLLFIPYATAAHPADVFPLLVPGWSLNLEMFFYAIFALALFLPRTLRLPVVGVAFAALLTGGLVMGPDALAPALRFFTSMRIVEFWFGMLIAQLLTQGALRIGRGAAYLLLAGGFIVLLAPALDVPSMGEAARILAGNALPASAIVVGIVVLELNGGIPGLPRLLRIGDASYSIYLTHVFSLGIARVIWGRLGLDTTGIFPALGFAIFGILLALLGGGLTYRFVENPMRRALQRRLLRPVPAPAPTPVIVTGTSGALAQHGR